jgi:hypothetical protein
VIPALMIPFINRMDLLARLLASIDEDVERLLVVNNSMEMTGLRPFVQHRNAGHVNVHTPAYEPLGYGGAINHSIMQSPEAPWWMWASTDVQFHPGHLASVERRMNEATGPRIITGGFTWAAVNRELVDTVGLIDEWSFFPIYFDDNDYHRRCDLAGVEWIEDWDQGSTHGDAQHGASLTIRSDPAAESANARSFKLNRDAYLAKWGGLPGHETFTTPWDSGLPVWAVRPDMAGRNSRRW